MFEERPEIANFAVSKYTAGRSAAPVLLLVRKVRTGKGTLLRKAQMGEIL